MIRVRRVSSGDLVRSLAAGPISYSRVFIGILVFELGGTAYALVRMLMLPEHAAIRHHVYFPLVAAFRAGPILATGYVLMVTLLAPISEELLFRDGFGQRCARRGESGQLRCLQAVSGGYLTHIMSQGLCLFCCSLPSF